MTSSEGSSPRMRGSPNQPRDDRRDDGIIPAHAGLTRGWRPAALTRRDHPRACGAHLSELHRHQERWGSSPRMRGSPILSVQKIEVVGIIPAHAGLTIFYGGSSSGKRDHPRACGAHPISNPVYGSLVGSSPRMRGSLINRIERMHWRGIIPAHAGLTHCHSD